MDPQQLTETGIAAVLAAARKELLDPDKQCKADAPTLEPLTTTLGVFVATASPAAAKNLTWQMRHPDSTTHAAPLCAGSGLVAVEHDRLLLLSVAEGGLNAPSVEAAVHEALRSAVRTLPGWKALYDRATAFELDRARADLDRVLHEVSQRAAVVRDWQIWRALLTHGDDTVASVARATWDGDGFSGSAAQLIELATSVTAD